MKLVTAEKRALGPLLAGLLLAGCRLTATDVEPALPAGRVDSSPTLVYRADGLPVVANNSVNLGTILVAFLGGRDAVRAEVGYDSTLSIFASDVRNLPANYRFHNLTVTVPHFHGVGTYQLQPAPNSYDNTYFQVATYDSLGYASYHAEQYLAASPANQLVITAWDSTSRVLQGTFRLQVSGGTELSDGRFDLDLE